jgi:hypothetical protein
LKKKNAEKKTERAFHTFFSERVGDSLTRLVSP